jgi:phosphomannomutase
MLEIISRKQKPLSELLKEFPKFHMRKEIFYCPETLKNAVMIKALKEWKKRKEEAEVITIDGMKIVYPDGSWMLLRPSGTEPVLRVYSESQDSARVQELAKVGSGLVKKAASSVRSRKKEPKSRPKKKQ